MLRTSLLAGALAGVAVATACRFDGGGVGGDDVGGDDVVEPDGAGPDAPDVDAAAGDARSIDAAPAIDAAPPDAPPPDDDGDGVVDAIDNCVSTPNPDQHDEDDDAVGDACDNCPHVENAGQESADGDEVGDVCDPFPAATDDLILHFDGFGGTTRAAGWTVGTGADTWSVADDRMKQTSTAAEQKILYWDGVVDDVVAVDVGVIVTEILPPADEGNSRSFGVVTGYLDTAGAGTGRLALIADNITSENPAYVITASLFDSGQNSQGQIDYLDDALTLQGYFLRARALAASHDVFGIEQSGGQAYAAEVSTPATGRVGLRTRSVAVEYTYVVIYGKSP